MTYKVLVGLEFTNILSEAYAQTQTGQELLTKYQTYLMANQESCGVVNQFIREASSCQYDNGIVDVLGKVSDYVTENKVSWALASACESINNSQRNYNMLNRNASRQVEKLLEQEETEVVKYIRAGALKNVMFCEAFRNIAKSVFNEQPIIEHKAEYTKITPVSLVENVNDGYCFVVENTLYKVDNAQNIVESNWNEVSNTFKTVSQLLASNITSIDENNINIALNNKTYTVSEEGLVKVGEKEMTVEQFRDNSRMQVMATHPNQKNNVAAILEAVALVSENYDNIVSLNNVAIYTTRNDKFIVIESNENLYATLLQSNRHPKWTINENAVNVLSFIKTKTNTELGEEYNKAVTEAVQKADEQHREDLEKQLNENAVLSIKERIALLTEKFKNDPAKLAILSKLATEAANI